MEANLSSHPPSDPAAVSRWQWGIAIGSVLAITVHLAIGMLPSSGLALRGIPLDQWPLLLALIFGGGPLVVDLGGKLFRGEFGSDLLAGLSILTSVILGEYLAGTIVVLMLSGGEALEAYAVRRASSVLGALAKRMPTIAHRREPTRQAFRDQIQPAQIQPAQIQPAQTQPVQTGLSQTQSEQEGPEQGRAGQGRAGGLKDVPLEEVHIGDVLVVFPHETCPVDGEVLEGHGTMDESYLTGEPYLVSKAPGASVLSGAVNGQAALTIRAGKRAADSRYAKIMQVMRDSEQRRPRLRRLGDQLGAWYTPVAVAVALSAWLASGDPVRFLAVLVVATPCPLLIAIPVAIIGAISLAARRGIIVKDPAVLERLDACTTAIFDKTGTLTYGHPTFTELILTDGIARQQVLQLVASLERYSKHPLAGAVLEAAREEGIALEDARHVSEHPGDGLRGKVGPHSVWVTSRKRWSEESLAQSKDPKSREGPELPKAAAGLECVVVIDGRLQAVMRFRDRPRDESRLFVSHLGPRHAFGRVLLVSGDRASEVEYLAAEVGIDEVYSGQTPEQKLELVRRETQKAQTVFVGDGINDAPAMTAATVGLAFGSTSDITAEAAGAVILESSLAKVDEFLHIGQRLRAIALQSAVGGMALSLGGMGFAAAGMLPPVAGALFQEVIDVIAVVNALRVGFLPRSLTDY